MFSKLKNLLVSLKPAYPYLLPMLPVVIVLLMYISVSFNGAEFVDSDGLVNCELLFREYNTEAKVWMSILVLSMLFAPIINFAAVAGAQEKKVRVVAAVCSYLLLASAAISQPKGESVNTYAGAAGVVFLSDLKESERQYQCNKIYVDRITGRFDHVQEALRTLEGVDISIAGDKKEECKCEDEVGSG